ncbi:hypothetical protein KP509_13G088800 [Ceratopteris richardii]|uniref:Uncharacterized protein n=1 Tax=Ceratopteris richardii TaxID=49495 RepID=A0A8T2TK05_CERRI|nr:hypothetical protein KP509_13G088800 [Ceratopteris richardii]
MESASWWSTSSSTRCKSFANLSFPCRDAEALYNCHCHLTWRKREKLETSHRSSYCLHKETHEIWNEVLRQYW